MNVMRQPIPLPLPVVPAADLADGLLMTVDLEKPILVQVEVWEAAKTGYYAQLVLNEELVGSIQTITETDQPGDFLIFDLSEKLLTKDGPYKLAYRASSPFSMLHEMSGSVPLIVDRVRPGAALLAPIIFPSVTLGTSLTGTIPGYSGMAIGDVVRVLCNDTAGPSIQVSAEHFESPIMIQIERSFLTGLGSAEVIVGYLITDRAGNTSAKSHPISVTLQI